MPIIIIVEFNLLWRHVNLFELIGIIVTEANLILKHGLLHIKIEGMNEITDLR